MAYNLPLRSEEFWSIAWLREAINFVFQSNFKKPHYRALTCRCVEAVEIKRGNGKRKA